MTGTGVCTCQVNPSAPWWLGPCVAHTKGLLAFAMLYQPLFSAACEQKWPLLGEVKVNSRNESDSQSTKIQNKQTNKKEQTNKKLNGLKMLLYCFDILAFNPYSKPHFYSKYFMRRLYSPQRNSKITYLYRLFWKNKYKALHVI